MKYLILLTIIIGQFLCANGMEEEKYKEEEGPKWYKTQCNNQIINKNIHNNEDNQGSQYYRKKRNKRLEKEEQQNQALFNNVERVLNEGNYVMCVPESNGIESLLVSEDEKKSPAAPLLPPQNNLLFQIKNLQNSQK